MTLHAFLERQAALTPERVAVIPGRSQLTYRALNEKSNQIAHLLRERGVCADQIVGIELYRSELMVIGLFAILKAGGAYMPIDPDFPDERKSYMLENSGTRILLTDGAAGDGRFSGEVINLADPAVYRGDTANLQPVCGPRNLAYVIYTSGSTGRPKGAMIEHRSIVNRIFWMQKTYPLGENSVILQKTRFTFDVSVWELFWWSFAGASVCMLQPGGEKDPEAIIETIEKNAVTTMHFVPSMFGAFLDYVEKMQCIDRVASLKHVFASGEALGVSHVDTFNRLLNRHNGTQLINLYGPTEAAVDVSYFNCSPAPNLKTVPIGRPIDNIRLYILDAYLSPVPVGVAGELYIGGVGVGRGYVNNEELTRERFIESPFVAGDVLYKTGDRARWFPKGDIEYLGRIDFQVKIRGIRIELGEIENALNTHDDIKEALVTGFTHHNNTYLCAYIVATRELSTAGVRDYLSAKVPEYMVPSFVMFLDEIPMLPNGKANRKGLPSPSVDASSVDDYKAPNGTVEEALAAIWGRLLGRDRISVTDNFFSIGGDSLLAIAMIVQIHKELNLEVTVREIFRLRTIRQLAEYLEHAHVSLFKPIEKLPDMPHYPLSSAQKRLFVLNRLHGEDLSYNLPGIIRIDRQVTADQVENVLKVLVDRHEALRTSFDIVGGEPVQIVHTHADVAVSCSNATAADVDALMGAFVKPFDLTRAPLLRAQLVMTDNDERLLFFDMHHIVSDGSSMNVLAREFSALLGGEVLPELSCQYKDYASWHNELLETGVFKEQEAYWVSRFSDEIPVLNMPVDFQRPVHRTSRGRKMFFELDADTTTRLKTLAAETGTTLYMVLFAVYTVLLHRYTAQEDVVIGIPVEGRLNADVSNLVGMFVNMLPIRNCPNGDKTFLQLLQEVRESLLTAYENQEYPFERLVDILKVKRDLGRNPLFDTSFVLQNFDLSVLPVKPFAGLSSKFDLSVEAFDRGETIAVYIEYATDLFEAATIKRLSEHFEIMASDIGRVPWKKLSDFEILPKKERDLLLNDFSGIEAEYPQDQTLQSIFEYQVSVTPDNIAVVSGDTSLTYMQLNAKANQLARVLREKGVGPDKIVAISLYRSEMMIVGLLAILKAGGAYLPIDPDYPEDRIRYMLEDSGSAILLTQGRLTEKWHFDIEIINIDDADIYSGSDENLSGINQPTDLAYVIYTSGSTGRPKGVMIEHKNVVRLLFNDQFEFSFSEKDIWTFFHAFCFDFSVWEMYGALLFGAKLIVISKSDAMDTMSFLKILKEKKVTILNQTPGAFYNLAVEECKYTDDKLVLRYVIFGGEALKPYLIKQFKQKYRNTKFVNMYGITETTVHVTYKEIDDCMIESNVSNIGRAIPTLKVYIMDKYLKLLPIGVPGELCISGEGVARGYLNNKPLTDTKFVESPYNKNEIIYRSEDLAKMLPSGEIEYLGRIDNQVKVRGYRIELGEIEFALLQHPEINEVFVGAFENKAGDKRIHAYYLAQRELSMHELQTFLNLYIPEYMIPSYFVKLEEMPLNINGKINKNMLPKFELVFADEFIKPRNDIENLVHDIWASILGIENISINSNFFELGGDSLSAIKVLASLPGKYLGVSLVDFYNYSTIMQFSEKILKISTENDILIKLASNRNAKKTVVCFPYGGGNVISFRDLSESISVQSDQFDIYAVNLPGHAFVEEKFINIYEAAEKISVEICNNLKNQIILYGHCVGSALVLETAKRILLKGYHIKEIILGATLPPLFSGILGCFYDPWIFYSDKKIFEYLHNIGLNKTTFDEKYSRAIIRAFRHDAKCFYRYFYDIGKKKNQRLDVPVVCIFGEKDNVTKSYEIEYKKWKKYAKSVTYKVIQNASHYFLNTHSDQLASIFLEVL
ncbi:amino acid adenylation domain-containing protein [Oscillospiraceae bacterium WX1]